MCRCRLAPHSPPFRSDGGNAAVVNLQLSTAPPNYAYITLSSGLSGTLPTQLGSFSALTYLDISGSTPQLF